MWKCPECGHVNVLKTKDLVPCYQSGSTAIKFELSDEETQKILEFKKLHNHLKEGELPHIKSIQQFTYSLTNYGAGYHIKIKCNECGEEKELC